LFCRTLPPGKHPIFRTISGYAEWQPLAMGCCPTAGVIASSFCRRCIRALRAHGPHEQRGSACRRVASRRWAANQSERLTVHSTASAAMSQDGIPHSRARCRRGLVQWDQCRRKSSSAAPPTLRFWAHAQGPFLGVLIWRFTPGRRQG